jgi:hypothetical protein
MRRIPREGFVLRAPQIVNDILIPRYYDPQIAADLKALERDYKIFRLGDLVGEKHIDHSQGDYVPKIYYGTGPYPYVRTSDLANWEIKASPKHGVPQAVYEDYATGQNVRPNDILFVHEGTYLIGGVGMVTEFDGPLLFQHHLAKFSVKDSSPFNPFFLLAAFESPLVHRQIRAKQFSADIIDSVVGRLEEVFVPVPRDARKLRSIESSVEAAIVGRARLRAQLAHAAEEMDSWLRGERDGRLQTVFDWAPDANAARKPAFLGGRRGFSSSSLGHLEVTNDILLPRYYDPWVPSIAERYRARCDMQTLGQLVQSGLISIDTGDEIGRLNYGTGDIPFVRTSDFGSWELKREAKQGVSQDVFNLYGPKQDVKEGDILLVRDGTYLVGTSILVTESDLPLLFCGGIYKVRSNDHQRLPPALLFALLNTPFVHRQIRNKQFTRDVIDTLGQRIVELLIPIPSDARVRQMISEYFDNALQERARLRGMLNRVTKGIGGLVQ